MKAPFNNIERELGEAQKAFNRCKSCMAALKNNWFDVIEIKQALEDDDEIYASLLWGDIELKDKDALMLAPKFGGIFTTKERAAITAFWRETGI